MYIIEIIKPLLDWLIITMKIFCYIRVQFALKLFKIRFNAILHFHRVALLPVYNLPSSREVCLPISFARLPNYHYVLSRDL